MLNSIADIGQNPMLGVWWKEKENQVVQENHFYPCVDKNGIPPYIKREYRKKRNKWKRKLMNKVGNTKRKRGSQCIIEELIKG